MDGFSALDFLDVVIEVLHSSNSTESSTQGAAGNCLRNSNTKLKKKGDRRMDGLSVIDSWEKVIPKGQQETAMLINCQIWITL